MRGRLETLRKSICRRENLVAVISAVAVIAAVVGIRLTYFTEEEAQQIKVGFVYVDDESAAYTYNFLHAQNAVDAAFDSQVETIAKYNVPEGKETVALQELADAGCELIFTTSYGYGEGTKNLQQTIQRFSSARQHAMMQIRNRYWKTITILWARSIRGAMCPGWWPD